MPEVKFEYSAEVMEEYAELGKAELELTNVDGNAFSIMAAVGRAMRTHGYSSQAKGEMVEDSMSGDYNHVIQTAMFWTDSPDDESDEWDDDWDDDEE